MATQPQPQPQFQSPLPPTSLNIRGSDLANALESLRTPPAVELSAVRTLRNFLDEANLVYWHGSFWPELYELFDDWRIDEYTRVYPAPASLSVSPPSKAFRALLRYVIESFDLGKLDLEVNVSNAARSIFEDTIAGAYGGDIDEEWKFMYDFFMDVVRALAEVFRGSGLRELSVKTSIWDGMGPWLAGQISGRETVVTDILPKYHDVKARLSTDEGVDESEVQAK